MSKNLAIVGYGKMGRLIDQLAADAGFSVGLKLDIDTNVNQAGITPQNFRGVDVAIEFSTPHTAVPICRRCVRSAFPPSSVLPAGTAKSNACGSLWTAAAW